jgi:hypothetical protein
MLRVDVKRVSMRNNNVSMMRARVRGDIKGKVNVHPRRGHEGPEGE